MSNFDYEFVISKKYTEISSLFFTTTSIQIDDQAIKKYLLPFKGIEFTTINFGLD